jgi:prepilin-type N-terminal cleavage/methylation domain-containing protein
MVNRVHFKIQNSTTALSAKVAGHPSGECKRGFTLIELLVVIAIIGIPAEDEARQD